MVAVTKLVRMAQPKAEAKPTSYVERRLTVVEARDKAICFEHPSGELVIVTDPRTGWPEHRKRLVWLPRSQIRLVAGEYDPGAAALVDVPGWLVREKDL